MTRERILVVQTAFLGDVVLTTPLLAALRHHRPDAAITVVTTPAGAPVLAHHPAVDRVLVGRLAPLGGVHLNSPFECSIPNVLNVSFEGVEGESLLFGLGGLAVSTGSACNSSSQEASYVLRALGRSDALAQGSLRFSMGRFTNEADVEGAIRAVCEQVARLRALSPA